MATSGGESAHGAPPLLKKGLAQNDIEIGTPLGSKRLAVSYDIGFTDPHIQVVDRDMRGDRVLRLEHQVRDGIPLATKHRDAVLKYVRQLWGYDVTLTGIDAQSGKELYQAQSGEAEEG